MDYKEVNLRCCDYEENLVFKKFSYPDGDKWYEFDIEDSYCGGDYYGIIGRFKRAWKTFWNKPVAYTSVYCAVSDEEKLKEFLERCLNVIKENNMD